ncbi:hypothetical protein L218DRAFT_896120 [Marasmius fiardii PR-910]|nr:hypothetical protein L218DRAFT_896120 [Marasmius fiardii PR-910]
MSESTLNPDTNSLDPEEILHSSLNTLYDYQPIIVSSSSGSVFEYVLRSPGSSSSSTADANDDDNSNDIPINLNRMPVTITLLTPDTDPSNWSLHASSIWASSRYLADHVNEIELGEKMEQPKESRCFRLLELGAGAGLPGIVIAKTHPQIKVTVSDYPDRRLIETLSENVKRNGVEGNCRAKAYAWGSEPGSLCDQKLSEELSTYTDRLFDTIIGADTLWNPEVHSIFIRSLQMLLKKTKEARVHLVAGLHTGRYTLQSFIKAGFVVESAIEREVNGDLRRPWDVNADENEKERRRWVVWITLRWACGSMGDRCSW